MLLPKFVIIAFVAVFGALLVEGRPQLDQEIDSEDDLLAVESQFFENEVEPYNRRIVPAPAGFPGQRIVAAPLSFSSPSFTVDNSIVNERPPQQSVYEDPHSYSFSFETPDGSIKRDESGSPRGSDSYVKSGGWEYLGTDGRVYSIRFVADEFGYRPVGNHLPTPPPLPPALQRFEDARSGKLSRRRLG